MARFGKLPVLFSDPVEVELSGQKVRVSGPKGILEREFPGVILKVSPGSVEVVAKDSSKVSLSIQGTTRSHIANMIRGVSEGWSRKLEMVGAGYRAELRGDTLVLAVGYSHSVEIKAPEGIKFGVEKSFITVEGADKERVGLIASRIRAIRPPEPYKGKGIRYADELVRRKVGKQAAKTTA